MTDTLLPLYTPSEPSPDYSCTPAKDERILDHTPRLRLTPLGTYTQHANKITVVLFDQDDSASMPTYGRNSTIIGTIFLEDPDTVIDVTLKLNGKLVSTISESGSQSTVLMSRQYTLWKKGVDDPSPELLPISCSLPSTFTYNGSEKPLPPSFLEDRTGHSFYVRVSYNLRVSVTRTLHRNIDFLTKVHSLKIPLNYYPRARASRPIFSCFSFLNTIKTLPEEWYQSIAQMKPRIPHITIDPIYCHFFIPSSRVYGVTDKVPFHIQISGPLDSLQKFLMPSPKNTSLATAKKRLEHSRPQIKVQLVRQICIETRGYKVCRNSCLGEATVWELPPAISTPRGQTWHLDWQGEVRARPGVTVGGFLAGNVTVKNFLVLEVEPPNGDNPIPIFMALQMNVPIRLVTDSYVEVGDYN